LTFIFGFFLLQMWVGQFNIGWITCSHISLSIMSFLLDYLKIESLLIKCSFFSTSPSIVLFTPLSFFSPSGPSLSSSRSYSQLQPHSNFSIFCFLLLFNYSHHPISKLNFFATFLVNQSLWNLSGNKSYPFVFQGSWYVILGAPL
jgi:hypothetical protein